MRANRSKDTRPELALRKALWAAGLRGYRVNVRKLPGTPDIVFRRYKLAILMNGCFWHQCPKCNKGIPVKNRGFWLTKLQANKDRDIRIISELQNLGFNVHVVWECEVKNEIASTIDQIRKLLISDQ